jgi:hypothetical protein
MFCSAHDKIISISNNLSEALCGVSSGYKVVLHDLPKWTFHVAAASADEAQKLAFKVAHSEGRARTDAATIQRF